MNPGRMNDTPERYSTKRALRMLSECSRALIRADDEAGLLGAVCRIAVEHGGYRLAWVGVAEADEAKTIRPAAQAGFKEQHPASLNTTWADAENGHSPTGTAIRTRRPVTARNIATDPAMAPWRADAIQQGYASSAALPLLCEETAIGALTVYSGDPDSFDIEETGVLMELAQNLAYSITSLRTRAEHRQAAEKLQESERRYDQLAEQGRIVTWEVNSDGLFTYVSHVAEQVWGYRPDELTGLKYFYDMHPDDGRAAFKAAAFEMVSERQPFVGLENPVQTKDGRIVWVSTNGVPVLDVNGGLRGYRGSDIDITEHKQKGEELRQREALFNGLFENHTAIKLLIDPDTGAILAANQTAEHYYGWPKAQLLQMKIQDINTMPPDELNLEMEKAKKQLRTYFEFRHRRSDGSIRDVAVFSSSIVVDHKNILHSIIHDITDRKQAEVALRRSEATIRSVFCTAPVGICIMKDRLFESVNNYMCETFGYREEEFIGKPTRMLYESDKEWARVGLEVYTHPRERGQASIETKLCRRDGTVCNVILITAPVQMDDPSAGTMAIVYDITARKQAENEAAQALRKTFLAELETIERLARAAEHKNEDTSLHIKRMSRYCYLIAQKLGLPPLECEIILMASPMHDVGKIGIPDAILMKPGKLDPGEWEIMKTHAEIGARILGGSSSDLLQAGEIVARSHHEKWDGSGYPRGLAGEAIPLFGRIAAVADVFDALTSTRPYKEAFSCEMAVQVMRNGRGTHFDPQLLDLFLDNLDAVLEIQEQYKDL